jgi:integrase
MRDPPPPRLLDRVRAATRLRHLSRRTEKAYVHWIRRFVVFHGKRHPTEMGEPEVTRFLSALATEGHVSASTQNQALAALLFLYRVVLGRELTWMDDVVRAKRPTRLPVVLSRDEVPAVLAELSGPPRLVTTLLYGAGLRVLEALRLRHKDVDFDRGQLVVRGGKGDLDRATMLPGGVRSLLQAQVERALRLHRDDVRLGAGWVELPLALGRKYPRAGREPRCPPLLRDTPPRGRLRHPDRPEAPRAPRSAHDHGLHPRPAPRPGRRTEPDGRPARPRHPHTTRALYRPRRLYNPHTTPAARASKAPRFS